MRIARCSGFLRIWSISSRRPTIIPACGARGAVAAERDQVAPAATASWTSAPRAAPYGARSEQGSRCRDRRGPRPRPRGRSPTSSGRSTLSVKPTTRKLLVCTRISSAVAARRVAVVAGLWSCRRPTRAAAPRFAHQRRGSERAADLDELAARNDHLRPGPGVQAEETAAALLLTASAASAPLSAGQQGLAVHLAGAAGPSSRVYSRLE